MKKMTKVTAKNVAALIHELRDLVASQPEMIELAVGRVSQKPATQKQSKLILAYVKKVLGRTPSQPDVFGFIKCGNKLDKYGGRIVRIVAEVYNEDTAK